MTDTIDFDKFGHCVLCHKNMLIKQIVDGKEIERLTADYTEAEYMLDDGSKMRVAMCKDCKSKLNEEDNIKIMKCVIRGWQEEVKNIKHWDEKRKSDYLDKYSSREIVCDSEDKHEDCLQKQLKAFKKDKEVKLCL